MTFEEYVKEEFKSKVWNALEDVAFDFADIDEKLHKEAMEEAIEWFLVHFYDESEVD